MDASGGSQKQAECLRHHNFACAAAGCGSLIDAPVLPAALYFGQPGALGPAFAPGQPAAPFAKARTPLTPDPRGRRF